MENRSKYRVNTFATNDKALSKPACNLGKRAMSLAQKGDGIHTLQLVIIRGEWRVSVNGRDLEYLGEVDTK